MTKLSGLTGQITLCISGNSSDYTFDDSLPLRAVPMGVGAQGRPCRAYAGWLPDSSLAGQIHRLISGILPVYPSNKTDRKVMRDIL